MNGSMFLPAVAEPLSTPLKKRRVLLVDTSTAKRDLRAETMRRLGIEVDCAANIDEAREWWRADLYKLVLIDMSNGLGNPDQFCEDMRRASPPQQLAFLVGKPDYLADSPGVDEQPLVQSSNGDGLVADLSAAISAKVGHLPQRWGIQEACQRIAATRSMLNARSQAAREKPAPPRDPETRYSKPTAAWSRILPELKKEEMQ